MNEPGFTPYVPRTVRFEGLRDTGSQRLKVYSIVYAGQAFDATRFEDGFELASGQLSAADMSAGRPGVGICILHQGQTGDYVVLCWWDRENELPTRVFLADNGTWRPARDGESFCVWDLEVMSKERDAYVATVLRGDGASVAEYLSTTVALPR